MPENDVLLILKERADAFIRRRKERILLEILIDIGKHKPLAPLSVGEVELPLGIEENVLTLQNVERLVSHDVPEGAYLGNALIDAGAFDVKKDVLHERGRSFSLPPM